MFRRFVRVVEALAVVAAVAFVVLLFANEPDDTPATATAADAPNGEELFGQRCAGCHGDDGEGRSGPRLAGGAVVTRFPDVADQIAVVRGGRGGMPSFGSRLTDAEIEAVVAYTRDGLP